MAERLGLRLNLNRSAAPGDTSKSASMSTMISQYSNHDYNSICIGPNGEALGANTAGIDRLWTEDQDNLVDIVASIGTHLMDFGTMALKRVPFVYLAGESSGRLRIRAYWSEDDDPRIVDATRLVDTESAQRVPLGEEKSRFWRFVISNPMGEDFSLDAIDAMLVVLER